MMTAKRMKIVLCVCPYEGEVIDNVTHKVYKPAAIKYMPLGLLSVAAHLREHDVTIIDGASRNMTVDEIVTEIEAKQPDILGLSVLTYRAWSMREILSKTSAPIKAVGGPHATKNSEYILQQGAHAVFVGDAEIAFPKWIQNECPPGVHQCAPVDLNAICSPARDLVDLQHYRIATKKGLLFDAGDLRLPIYSSKGCPLKCIYCDVQQKKFITMAPMRILKEFEILKQLGATSIHILDDAFNIEKNRVIEFCHLLQNSEFNTDWSIRGIVEVREEVIKALANAGCKRFHVGIEHFDDDILAYFRKSHRYKHIQKFCEMCNKYGISILAYFIIGAPNETSLYRESLPDKIRENGIDIPYFNVLTPLNETIFYQQLLDEGVYKQDIWDNFARNPVKNFSIPSHRSSMEEQELQNALQSYLDLYTSP